MFIEGLWGWLSQDGGVAVEGADFGGKMVHVMETAVVGVGRYPVNRCHRIESPWSENEQAAVSAGLKSHPFGFPIGRDGFFLDMDERIIVLEAFVFHHQFAMRYAGGDHHRCPTEDGIDPLLMLAGIVGRGLVRLPADGMPTVALHLHLAWPPQQEEVAECAIVAVPDLDMQGALHQLRQGPPQNGPPRIIVNVGDHGLAVPLVEAHRVVVILVE